jgi:hypothetical protein
MRTKKMVANKSVAKKVRAGERYCGLYLPRAPIPAGRYLVHNHFKPAPMLGLNGFRAWTTNDRSDLEECHCDFGGCKNAELHRHYRIKAALGQRITGRSRQAEVS